MMTPKLEPSRFSGVSVIIHDLDPLGSRLGPDEADPVLIVHPDRALSGPASGERLQAVARRHSKILEGLRRVQQIEFPRSDRPGFPWTRLARRLRIATIKDVLGAATAEGPDHWKHDSTDIMLYKG